MSCTGALYVGLKAAIFDQYRFQLNQFDQIGSALPPDAPPKNVLRGGERQRVVVDESKFAFQNAFAVTPRSIPPLRRHPRSNHRRWRTNRRAPDVGGEASPTGVVAPGMFRPQVEGELAVRSMRA